MKGRWEEQWRLEIQKLAAAEWLQCKGKSNRAKQQFQGRSKICNTKICLSINLLQQKQEVIDVGYHMFEANMLDVRWSDVKNAKSVCWCQKNSGYQTFLIPNSQPGTGRPELGKFHVGSLTSCWFLCWNFDVKRQMFDARTSNVKGERCSETATRTCLCHRYSGYQALQSPVVLMDDARPESRWGPLSWQNSSNSPRCVKFSYVRHETSEMSNVRHVTFRIEMIQECHKCQIQMFWEWCSPRCVKFSCVRQETSEMSNVRHSHSK